MDEHSCCCYKNLNELALKLPTVDHGVDLKTTTKGGIESSHTASAYTSANNDAVTVRSTLSVHSLNREQSMYVKDSFSLPDVVLSCTTRTQTKPKLTAQDSGRLLRCIADSFEFNLQNQKVSKAKENLERWKQLENQMIFKGFLSFCRFSLKLFKDYRSL